jgi:hypothetical protein
MKLSDLITGDDGKALEPAYAMSTLVIVVGLCLQVYSTIYGKPFDLQAYGIGAAALLGGLGISAKLGK